MTDIPKSARAFIEMANGLAAALSAIDQTKSLEQAERDAKARLAELARAELTARNTLEHVAAKVDAARSEALAITDQAKIDAEAIKAKAGAEGTEILAAAREAALLAKGAQVASEQAERRAVASHAKAREDLAGIQAQLAEARATIAKAEAIKKAMG